MTLIFAIFEQLNLILDLEAAITLIRTDVENNITTLGLKLKSIKQKKGCRHTLNNGLNIV